QVFAFKRLLDFTNLEVLLQAVGGTRGKEEPDDAHLTGQIIPRHRFPAPLGEREAGHPVTLTVGRQLLILTVDFLDRATGPAVCDRRQIAEYEQRGSADQK